MVGLSTPLFVCSQQLAWLWDAAAFGLGLWDVRLRANVQEVRTNNREKIGDSPGRRAVGGVAAKSLTADSGSRRRRECAEGWGVYSSLICNVSASTLLLKRNRCCFCLKTEDPGYILL